MGGNVFKMNKPILAQQVSATVENLMSELPYKYAIIGSAGKVPSSGDIDIAIEYDDSVGFMKDLVALLGKDRVRKTGVISADIDVLNSDFSETGTRVQVDFILGNDMKLMELFYYHDRGSSFKSAHRNIAINAVAAYTDLFESEEVDDYERPVEIRRYKWSPLLGLVQVLRKSREHIGNGRTVKKQDETVISESITDAASIAETLFGVSDPGLIISFESVYDAINKFINHDVRQKIFEKMISDFEMNQSINVKTWDYPPELTR